MLKKKTIKSRKIKKKTNRKPPIKNELTKKELVRDISNIKKEKKIIIPEDERELEQKISPTEISNFSPLSTITEESRSLVLERIAVQQPGPIFISRFFQNSQTSEIGIGTSNTEETKYLPDTKNEKDKKYLSYESEKFLSEIAITDISQLGRGKVEYFPKLNQETFFQRSSELKQIDFESPMMEKIFTPKENDTYKFRREDNLEKERERYEINI